MAQVSSTDIRTRIKNVLESSDVISGFTPSITVFDVVPMALTRADLPCIIITDGAGTYNNTAMGNRYLNGTTTYAIALYAQEWTANNEVNIQATLIDAIHTAIEDVFTLNNPLIYSGENLKGVRDAKLTSFTAIQPRAYPQVQNAPVYVYRGWNLNVTYTRKV
jgi:hypothetical protein